MTADVAGSPVSDDQLTKLERQVEKWREDLLNLDRRQRLVYFHHTRTASLELIETDPHQVLTALSAGRVLLRPAVVDEEGADDGIALPLSSDGILVQDKNDAQLRSACRRLDQLSHQVYADRGFWTLYVGLGMLRWIDPDDQQVVTSPVLLCPVAMKRNGAQSPYSVVRTEDEIVVNPALKLKLEKDFGISLPDVDPDALDVSDVLEGVEDRVRSRPGWTIDHRVVLTTFSFHKEAIYRDLHDHEAAVVEHPMVQLIALGDEAPSAGRYAFAPVDDVELDTAVPPEQLMSILDADSSQRQSILAAREGRSFVMDGPPGTGKSQTIANIICELIATGKTVLFVSEKAAALDVVRDRLTAVGLGDFLLELHSHAATRKAVVEQLGRALTRRAKVKGGLGETDRQSLHAVRQKLTSYATAMNEVRVPLHRSVYEVLGRMMEIREHAHGAVDRPEDWGGLSAVKLDDVLGRAGRLARSWRPVTEDSGFLWRRLRNSSPTQADIERMRDAAAQAADATAALVRRVEAVDGSLGWVLPMSLAAVKDRHRLLELLENRPPVPEAWLHRAELDPLRGRADQRRAVAERLLRSRDALVSRVGDGWSAVDPDLLPVARSGLEPQPDPIAPWGASERTSVKVLGDALTFQEQVPVRLQAIDADVRQLGAMLGIRTDGISIDRALQLAELAALGAQPARPERDWLNPAVQSALDESSRVLAELVSVVNQRRAAIERVFTPAALELDLAGMNVRFTETHVGLRRFGKAARDDRKALRAVTVSGKVDKGVLASLDEAVAWQQAEQRLTHDEQTYAPRLGRYYQRTETDFARLTQAITTAHQAVQLAAGDLNAGPMAEQLAAGGTPDAQLIVVAERLKSAGTHWLDELYGLVGAESAAQIRRMPLRVAAESAVSAADRLRAGHEALAAVTEVAGQDLTVKAAIDALEQATTVAECDAALLDTFETDRVELGEMYVGAETNWESLFASLGWAEQVRGLTGSAVSEYAAERMMSPTVAPAELAQPIDVWNTAVRTLTADFGPDQAEALGRELQLDLGETADLLAEMAETARADIAEWASYVAARQELVATRLTDVVASLESRRLPADVVEPTIENAVFQAWVESTVAADGRLGEFRAGDRDALVERFRSLDKELVDATHVVVAEACNRRRPKTLGSAAANTIQREAQKKSRHLPIRDLLSRTEDLVQELKPCFMMSPLSVSQFLPGGFGFDVVIFDEASQVLPSDAVNCIYRGRQLIVAGDEKQLPPTAFFTQVVDESEEDEGLADFESVLTLCKTTFPALPLTWHYRSRHESLIAYSNYRFYTPDDSPLRSGNLQTFPGAKFLAPDLGVELFVVDGVYHRGGARDNPVEADKVVDRILHHRQNHPGLSIGVVTFSTAQEDAITAALDRRSATEPSLRSLLDNHDRLSGFFVKNLENVQGDERDIIIFSVGYGPDEFGKLEMKFGPLNPRGGWRRLNVAITRAKMRVEVVSSFRAAQMRDTPSEGVRHLRRYLDFAERGLPALGLDVDEGQGDVESPFEADVLEVIRSWGYDVTPQVGTAGYRIDLGVRHPDRPGEYVLGVECDGAAYHSAKAARDRDRLRASVLEGLGWRLHRIWGISWYRDRSGQLNRLRQAIEDAVAGVAPTAVAPSASPAAVEMESIDLGEPPEWAVSYKPYAGAAPFSGYELGSVEGREPLHSYMTGLLRHEAPVHQDVVNKRIREAFHIGRIGSAIRDNIRLVARRIRVDGKRVTVDPRGIYRIEGEQLTSVRVPDDPAEARTVLQVPGEELDLAVVRTVRDAVSAGDPDIVASVTRIFGWRRTGNDISAAVATSINRCLHAGSLERTSSGAIRATS